MEYELIDKNIKLILSQILTENITEKIIVSSISKDNIKDLIENNIIKYVDDHKCENFNRVFFANRNEILEYIEKYFEENLNFEGISCNQKLTLEYIDTHPEIKWDWYWGISHNPNLTIGYVEKHPDKNWNWRGISANLFSQYSRKIENNMFHIIFE